MAGKGHEDPFPPPALCARYVIRQETFAGTHGNGRDAPKADISYRAAAAHAVRILLRRDNPWTENN
jgi:hypothetical protein